MAVTKPFGKAVTVAAAATAMFVLVPLQSAGAEPLSLLGTWTGQRERIASTERRRTGTATLLITEQTGQTFKGATQWSTPDGPAQDDLVGAFTPEGKLIAGADAEDTYTFTLVTLDYCYAEHGDGVPHDVRAAGQAALRAALTWAWSSMSG
ncbi:MAG: hypothetical protein JWR37_6077 [Mycobacterium sp.]|nr:hypothetical protein [Mycobacterium sp.]